MLVEIKRDLSWLADNFERSSGKLFIKNPIWSISEADTVIYVDACPMGIGIWDPEDRAGLSLSLPPPSRHISWAECLAICAAVVRALEKGRKKIFIFSDSLLCFELFSRHNPNSIVRPLFRHFVHGIVKKEADVKIHHISGESNTVADALSRGLFEKFSR